VKRLFAFTGLVVLLLSAAAVVRAQSDQRIGTWKLNVAKSKASNGNVPQNETRTYEAQGSEIMCTVTGANAKGQPINNHFNATADGKDYPTSANPSATVSIKQTGPGAYAGTLKNNGKVMATNTAVISGGGKMFTIEQKGTDAEGKEYTSTIVFEKQ